MRESAPCASIARTTILNQVLTGHRMSTESPQSIPIKTHNFLKAKTHTNTSRLFCHTAHTRAHLISCVGGVTTRHRNHICLKLSSASVWPYGSQSLDHTGVQCLINWHGLTFNLPSCPHAPTATWRGSKVTLHPGHAYLSPQPSPTPQCPSSTSLVKPHPIGSNKTCIILTHTLHTVPGTRPQA